MLDDEDCIALADQNLKNLEELFHIVEMKASRRLIQNINRSSGGATVQLARQLDPLGFAPR